MLTDPPLQLCSPPEVAQLGCLRGPETDSIGSELLTRFRGRATIGVTRQVPVSNGYPLTSGKQTLVLASIYSYFGRVPGYTFNTRAPAQWTGTRLTDGYPGTLDILSKHVWSLKFATS